MKSLRCHQMRTGKRCRPSTMCLVIALLAANTVFATQEMLKVPSGILTRDPTSSDGAVASRLNDGDLNTEWRSPYNVYRNDLEYKFDPTLSGTSGLDGNDANLFTLRRLNLYNWSNPYGLRSFQVFVKTRSCVDWEPVDAPVSASPFNFLLDANGAILTNDPGSADGAVVSRLTDASQNTEWRSPYNVYRNDLEYKFDPTLSGTSGLDGNAANLFTLNQLNLYNWSNPYGLKDFQVFVKTLTSGVLSDWTPVYGPVSATPFDFLLDVNGAILTRDPDSADGAVASRLTDASLNTEWRSPYNVYRNDLEYKFDPTLSGISGLDGNDANLLTLSQLNLYNWSNPYGLKNFQIFVKTRTSGVSSDWTPVDAPASATPFNFLLDVNGAILTRDPGSADGAVASRLTDSSLNTEWRSPYNVYRNDLEYKFDPTLSGTSGLDGNDANRFTLSQLNLSNWSYPYGLKNFQIFVKTRTSGVVSDWTPVDAPAGATPFNFLLDANGAILTRNPGSADGAVASRLTDASQNTEWRSPYNVMQNDLEYKFDPTLSGTSGLDGNDANLFSLSQINLYTWSSPYGVKDFQLFVQTRSGGVTSPWTLVSIAGTTTLTASTAAGMQTWMLDVPIANVVALRLRTLNNRGGDRVIIYEMEALGAWAGKQTVYTAANATGIQNFTLPSLSDVVALRLRTLSNYGGDRIIVYEMEAPGSWAGKQTVYTAANATGIQRFTLAAAVPNVAALRLRTLSNYGGDRTILYEMEAPGSWAANQTLFTAANVTGIQSFTLAAPVPNVAALRLRTLSNYGGDRTILYEMEAPGTWSGRRTVFTAANTTGSQSFTPATVVPNVAALRLRTLSNYGGDRTILYESQVWGDLGLSVAALPNCSWSASSGPASFNCVEVGANANNGHLYTKLVGTPFNFDLVALKADGSLEPNYAANTSQNVSVALVDGSGGMACAGRTTQVTWPGQTFPSGNAGRISASSASVARAYPDLVCRVTDVATSLSACSSDHFSVRPSTLTLTSTANADASNGSNLTATPIIKAGSGFTLSATATVGYNGTPVLDTGKLQASAGAVHVGTLAGGFAAADAVTGIATGSGYTYGESGYFRLLADAVTDTSFTGVDAANGDCTADYSNVSVGGKYGCYFGNSAASGYVGRFVPDHFALSSATLTPGCGGFTYYGQDFSTAFTLTAQNSGNVTTRNYNALDLSTWGHYGFAAAGATLVSGVAAPTGSWGNGVASVTASLNVPRALSGTPTSPATLTVTALPVDSDGVTLAATAPIATTVQRFGRLRMQNATGTTLLSLPVPLTAQYWSGTGFATNAEDNCTTVSSLSPAYHLANAATPTPNYASPLVAGNAGLAFSPASPSTLTSGYIDLTAAAPAWLKYNWDGVATGLNLYDDDPHARASFSGRGGSNKVIIRRELY